MACNILVSTGNAYNYIYIVSLLQTPAQTHCYISCRLATKLEQVKIDDEHMNQSRLQPIHTAYNYCLYSYSSNMLSPIR